MNEPDQVRTWDFDAGRLPLDFSNTAEMQASDNPTETLHSYSDLVAWSVDAGLLTEPEAQSLLAKAEKDPEGSAAVLKKAIIFRTAIYKIFSAVAGEKELDEKYLNQLNETLAQALKKMRIAHTPEGFSWGWISDLNSLDIMLWKVARSTADLLTSEDLDRVGECADDRGCGYLFLDTSRNKNRRWCSMDSCGNRAKAQRHYHRQKEKGD